jgi:RimJ/RimL family protein N-acetyltransferase
MAITLREFARDDFARLIEWVNVGGQEAFLQWAGTAFKYPLSEAQLEAHLAETEGPEPTRRVFVAVEDTSGEVVGHVELSGIDLNGRSASISRLLVGKPSARGKGIGATIVSRLLDVAFGEMQLHRVDIYVLDLNVAAIRLYEDLGFETEDQLVEPRRGGRYWNVYYLSMLRQRWLNSGKE